MGHGPPRYIRNDDDADGEVIETRSEVKKMMSELHAFVKQVSQRGTPTTDLLEEGREGAGRAIREVTYEGSALSPIRFQIK